LIVFAPVNADPEDEDSRIYMVCPASLKVVEVVEKYDDEAINYLSTLGKSKKRTEIPAKEFIDDLGKEFEGEIEVAGEMVEEVKEIIEEDEGIAALTDELDEDVVTFASGKLEDIFPDDPSDGTAHISDVDMADALELLDQDDDESDLNGLSGFVDDEELPEL